MLALPFERHEMVCATWLHVDCPWWVAMLSAVTVNGSHLGAEGCMCYHDLIGQSAGN